MNSINHMKWAMGNAERIRDIQDAELDRKIAARTEALETCKAIREYFSNDAWDTWCEAIPNDVYEFREYAQTEQEAITAELVKVAEWLAPAPVADPRDDDQKAWDAFCAEVNETRRHDYPY